jgi:hypothetical protein
MMATWEEAVRTTRSFSGEDGDGAGGGAGAGDGVRGRGRGRGWLRGDLLQGVDVVEVPVVPVVRAPGRGQQLEVPSPQRQGGTALGRGRHSRDAHALAGRRLGQRDEPQVAAQIQPPPSGGPLVDEGLAGRLRRAAAQERFLRGRTRRANLELERVLRGDHPAGVDARRRVQDRRVRRHGLRGRRLRKRELQPAFLEVVGVMHLHVPQVGAGDAADHLLAHPLHHAVGRDAHRQARAHREDRDQGTPALAPQVAPGHLPEQEEIVHAARVPLPVTSSGR